MNSRVPFRKSGCFGCLVLLGLLAVFLIGLNWILFGNHAEWAEHVTSYGRAPAGARDISWYESRNISGNVAFEFLLPETEFKAWAEGQNWLLEEITPTRPPVLPWTPSMFIHKNDVLTPEVTTGLFYEKRAGNGGGVTAVYDRATSRVYIHRSSR